jgi:hypothetical protein
MCACLLLIIFTDYSQSFVIDPQSEGPSRNNNSANASIDGEQVGKVSVSIRAPSFAIDPQLELEGQLYSNTPASASINGEQVGEVSEPTRAPSFVIDPQHELDGQPYNNTPTRASSNGEQVGSTPTKSYNSDDRVRPTTYNPLYGFVEGAKRGNMDWSAFKIYVRFTKLTCYNFRCSSYQDTPRGRN